MTRTLRCRGARGRWAVAVLGVALPALGAFSANEPVQGSARYDVPGGVLSDRVLLRLHAGCTAASLVSDDTVASLLARWRVTSIRPTFDPVPKDRKLAEWLGMDRCVTLWVPSGTQTIEMARDFGRVSTVIELAEVDVTGLFDSPSDPLYAQQWYLDNFGQTACNRPGLPDADIDWSDALAALGAVTPTTIAVVDTGVSISHPDLAGKLVPGRNVVQGAPDPSNTDDLSNPSHGTMCAGVIAASLNNQIGIVGVAPSVYVMPIKFANSTTGLTPSGSILANGLLWAADHGARVCSVSFGLPTVGPSAQAALSSAVSYCEGRGVLVVTSMGNDPGAVSAQYPAKYPYTIAVGAVTNQDVAWSSQSTAEGAMDITAPGQCVLTTVDEPAMPNGYDFRDGTSLSTPIVAGVAGLIWSINPSLTAAQVRQILQSTADDLGTPGLDPIYGYGRVNAAGAVLAAIATIPRCEVDLNGTGTADTGDLFAFLDLYYSQAGRSGPGLTADFSHDNFVDVGDLFAFMLLWFAGC